MKHLLSNKLAIAIFGAVLVAIAGSAAALAASGNTIHMPFASQSPSSQNSTGQHNDDQDNGHEAEGTITSIDTAGSRFVVNAEHGVSVTVVVNSATLFADGLHSFADLKTGMSVEVDGNPQSDGTLTATNIHGESEGADDHSGSGSSSSGRGGHDDGTPHG